MPLREIYTELRYAGLRPTIPPYVPPLYRALLSQCWGQDPSERPSFAECVARLEHRSGAVRAAAVDRPVSAPASAMRLRVAFENEGCVVCISAYGNQVWAGLEDGGLRVFTSKGLQQVRREKVHAKVCCVCSLSEWCTFSGAVDGSVNVWAPQQASASRSLLLRVGSGKIPRPLKLDGAVTCLVPLFNVMLLCTSSGAIRVMSHLVSSVLAESEAPEPILCACAVGPVVWVAGTHLYAVKYGLGGLTVDKISDNAHDGEPCQALVYAGDDVVWSCTYRGQVRGARLPCALAHMPICL
jgi:hypothetical protein